MNTNKHESTEKVVGSILERTTQYVSQVPKTALQKISENALSCISCFSWLINLYVSSVCSACLPKPRRRQVVKNGGIS
jgi:recombinational DNA repair protein RecR